MLVITRGYVDTMGYRFIDIYIYIDCSHRYIDFPIVSSHFFVVMEIAQFVA